MQMRPDIEGEIHQIGVARLDCIDTIDPNYCLPALYWLIDGY